MTGQSISLAVAGIACVTCAVCMLGREVPSNEHEVMTACGTGEQWQRALGFLCMIDGLRLRKTIVSFNAALRACGKCAKWQHALHIFRFVGDSQLQGDSVTYRTIISACSQEWNQALQLLQEGRETILATECELLWGSNFCLPSRKLLEGGAERFRIYGRSGRGGRCKKRHICDQLVDQR